MVTVLTIIGMDPTTLTRRITPIDRITLTDTDLITATTPLLHAITMDHIGITAIAINPCAAFNDGSRGESSLGRA
jgi:hypothetical protein